MGVSQETMKWQRWAQQPASASQASPAGFPLFDGAMPDLFVRRAVRNAKHRSGPSVRLVRLVSSPVRFPTMQVQMHAGELPSPIDDIAGCRILLGARDQLKQPEHAGTIDISYRFPAGLVCPWISS